jgi:hypothetical protein
MLSLCLAIMERVNYEAILECLLEFSCKNTYLYVTHTNYSFFAQFSYFGESGAAGASYKFKFEIKTVITRLEVIFLILVQAGISGQELFDLFLDKKSSKGY